MEEKKDYKLYLDTATLAGKLMLQNGAEIYRVEDTIQRMLAVSGLKTAEAYVTATGIMVTLDDPKEDSMTVIKRIPSRGTDLNTVSIVNDISRKFCSGQMTLKEAFHDLKHLDSRQYTEFQKALGVIGVALFFALVFGGSWRDALAAGIDGVLIVLALRFSKWLSLNAFMETMLSSVLLAAGSSGHEPAYRYQRGHGDHRSHHAHRSWCGLYDRDPGHAAGRLCGRKRQSAGVSYQGGGHCGGRRSWNDYDRGISCMIVQVISAFFAILAFSVVNNVPKKFLLYCGLEGSVGWFVYLIFLPAQGAVMANFFGSLALAIMAHVFARVFKAPVTVFLIPGLLILVPGAGLFRSAYQLFLGTKEMAAFYMLQTLEIAGMIALAVFVVDSFFSVINKKRRDLEELHAEKK